MPAVELQDVHKRFGDAVAVSGFSLRVEPGEALCLFGPSGCGKTTVLRLIAGLEKPDKGRIAMDISDHPGANVAQASRLHDQAPRSGLDVAQASRLHHQVPRQGAIGMVFQDGALWPHMRARKHLDFVLRGTGLTRSERRDRIQCTLEACCLWEQRDAYPAELSGGECQRLAIARALATNPTLLLLDEPFAHLDEALRDHILSEVRRRVDAGVTVIVATHDRDEAQALGARIMTME